MCSVLLLGGLHTLHRAWKHTHTVESSFLCCVTSMSFSPLTTLIKLNVDITQDDHGKLSRNGIQKFQFVNFPTFQDSSMGKESACNAEDTRDPSLIPRSGRSFGERNGNPLQCSCLENPRDGGAWWAAVYGVTQSWTRLKQLSRSSSIFTDTGSGGSTSFPDQLVSDEIRMQVQATWL